MSTRPVEAPAVDDHPVGGEVSLHWVEIVTAVLIVVHASRALHSWYPSFGLVADDRLTTLGRAVWPGFAVVAVVAVMRRPWLDRRPLDPLMMAAIGLLSISVLWSIDTVKTLYQAIVLVSVLACSWFLATAFRPDAFVRLAGNVLTVVCGVNLVAALSGTNLGTGATTGFFEHKNLLGLAAAASVLLVAARLLAGERSRWLPVSGVVSASALFVSGARTSQFGALLVLVLLGFIVLRRRNQAMAMALAAPVIALYAVLLWASGGVAAMLTASGKSSDLTGRTDVWDQVTALISERPALGWGYLAYWRDSGFGDGRRSGFEEFGLRSAHSSYLEAALGAGVIAGVLVAVALIVAFVRGHRRSVVPRPRAVDVALFATAFFAAVVGISESFFPSTTRTLLTVLVVTFSAGPMMRELNRDGR